MHTKNMQETVLTNSKAEVMLGVLKKIVLYCMYLSAASFFFYSALFAVYPHNSST